MSDEFDPASGELAAVQDDSFQRFLQQRINEQRQQMLERRGLPLTYKVRFRFRLGQQFATDDQALAPVISGRVTELRPESAGTALSSAGKLIWMADSFDDEAGARAFGNSLQRATAIVAARRRFGADIGYETEPDFELGPGITDPAEAVGLKVRESVDGVVAYPDDGGLMFVGGEADLVVRGSHKQFLAEIQRFVPDADKVEGRLFDVLVILNAAVMNTEPLARLALAVAAVEMLASSDKRWSTAQMAAMKSLVSKVEEIQGLSRLELEEVRDAANGMKNFGVNASCRRLIRKLELDHLLDPWKALYTARSRIFHGAAYPSKNEIARAAELGVSLSARIVLAAVGNVVEGAEDGIEGKYPLTEA